MQQCLNPMEQLIWNRHESIFWEESEGFPPPLKKSLQPLRKPLDMRMDKSMENASIERFSSMILA
jgi:hypothetical protein